jgi:hypothetical protein
MYSETLTGVKQQKTACTKYVLSEVTPHVEIYRLREEPSLRPGERNYDVFFGAGASEKATI